MYTFVYTYRHKQSGKINSIKLFLLLSRHIWRINTKRISIFYFMLCCACWLSHVQLFSTPWAVAHQAPLSMEILQARILEWIAMPSSRGSSHPRDQTQVSCTAGRFFTIWVTKGKPKNTGVGRISLLHGIFPTQELKRDLVHCRRILYQLSYQGSPLYFIHLYIS